jgi:hypothetical protein
MVILITSNILLVRPCSGALSRSPSKLFVGGHGDFPVQFFHLFSSGHVVRREAAPARGPSSALVVVGHADGVGTVGLRFDFRLFERGQDRLAHQR